MKKLFLACLLALLFFIHLVSAANSLTIKQQLDKLNKCWLNKHFDDAILKEKIPLNDDVSLIRMHLILVEKKLREANSKLLSTDQQEKRNQCLDILHSYCERGVFPKNLYHNERTPYFIDKFGTACAVGQLIVSTGYEVLAKKISSENNYAYISELNGKYSELKKWADEYGFSIDELAWIQPSYGPDCDPTCNKSAYISVRYGISPFTYLWSNGATTPGISGLCPNTWFSCIVTDSIGTIVTSVDSNTYIGFGMLMGVLGDSVMIFAYPPVKTEITSTPDDGTWIGTATVNASGGPGMGYTYSWSPGGQTTQTITGLGYWRKYSVMVLANGAWYCGKSDSVVIDFSVDIHKLQNSGIVVFPNPASDKVTVSGYKLSGTEAFIEMYNIFGEKIFQSPIIQPESEIDISSLAKGIYVVQITDGEKIIRRKVVKE